MSGVLIVATLLAALNLVRYAVTGEWDTWALFLNLTVVIGAPLMLWTTRREP